MPNMFQKICVQNVLFLYNALQLLCKGVIMTIEELERRIKVIIKNISTKDDEYHEGEVDALNWVLDMIEEEE